MDFAHDRTAVDLVQEFATERWRRSVVQRLTAHLGEEVWYELDLVWDRSHCRRLAKAARKLAGMNPSLAHFDSVLGRESIKNAVKRSSAAAALVGRATATAADMQTATVVLALRFTGIVLCELHGCITDCQCLKDLDDETSFFELSAKITEICDGYFPEPDGPPAPQELEEH